MKKLLKALPDNFEPEYDDELRAYLRELEWHPNNFTCLDAFIRELVNRLYKEAKE